MKNSWIEWSWPKLGCLLHAILILGIWVLVFKFNLDVMPGKVWMGLALVWFVWLVVAVMSKRENRMRWVFVIAIGVLLLSPTISTLYTFTVWSIEGFAP